MSSAAFKLYGVFFHYEAAASTGVSVILDHPTGTTWDTIITSSTLVTEQDASYIPTAPLQIPTAFGIKAWTQAPKVTGCTRHVTIIIGY
jgi:hypothetical protein